ncbi:MAG: ribose-phosphate pyrophosphokinase [Deltaproteobacteria bacterium]|nr:ribose-phosphate pyrophosphokinase [Deltaproteobacteria bacterium]
MLLFGGQANPPLYKKICDYLNIDPGHAFVGQFSDGETRVELKQSVRGADVFIIQSTCEPANHHIMEALVLVDACRRASAKQITLVTPYFGYARQEKKSAPRTPVTARLVANLMEAAGISRLLSLELHNSALQGFFNVPVDHLFAKPVFCQYFQEYGRIDPKQLTVVSPDAGGVERARALAKQFCCELAIIDKRRDRPNQSAVRHLVGEVSGRDCLIVDDIVDTGGSLVNATHTLLEKGARTVRAAITHPVLSGPALALIREAPLEELLVTDSIPLSEEALACKKIVQVSIAGLIADAIRRIHQQTSISSLFL